jgi:adenylate cyclase
MGNSQSHSELLNDSEYIKECKRRIEELKSANAILKSKVDRMVEIEEIEKQKSSEMECSQQLMPLFQKAESLIQQIFYKKQENNFKGIIEIFNERYILVKVPSLSVQFYKLSKSLLNDEEEALSFTYNLLYDLAQSVGKIDASKFNSGLDLHLVVPIHFAFTGFSNVKILKFNSEREDFFILFDNLSSFEADSYIKCGFYPTLLPVCSICSGYPNGWVESSFNTNKLVTVEILCKARGDSVCRFITSNSDKIMVKIREYKIENPKDEIFIPINLPGYCDRSSTERVALNKLKEHHDSLQEERKKVIFLLKNLYPDSIVKKFQFGEPILPQKKENATILLADIVDFNSITLSLDAKVIVMWINSLFTKIDDLIDLYQLEKIKTIGDAYMAAGGISIPNSNHTESVLLFALNLLEEIKKIKDPNGNPVSMKIGVYTGPVCSGVVGKKKLAFDIWGDCVNIVNEIEYLSEPCKILCSSKVFEQERKKFQFEAKGLVNIGKGSMMTYYCTGKK